MLREPLPTFLSAAQEPYRPDAKTLQHQEELRLIFKRQQEKGGIIDPEAERNRYFISLQAVWHRGQRAGEGRALECRTERHCRLPWGCPVPCLTGGFFLSASSCCGSRPSSRYL